MQKQIAKELDEFAKEICKRYSMKDREANYNN